MGAIWGSFGGLGVSPGGLRRPVGSRNPLPLLALLHFIRFWLPKGSLKTPKISVKSMKIHAKIDLKFGGFFWRRRERRWSTLGVILGAWTLENECFV